MPVGTHWEWRGYGRVSDDFVAAFRKLPLSPGREPGDEVVRDQHVFLPGASVHVKLHLSGREPGLRLRRLLGREGGLELWADDPTDIRLFEEIDQRLLADLALQLGLTLRGRLRSGTLPPEHVVNHLRAGIPPAEVVSVTRKRTCRLARPDVEAELAEITQVRLEGPEPAVGLPLFSVRVSSLADLSDASATARIAAGNAVRLALAELGVGSEPLVPSNELLAIALWKSRAFRVVERSRVPRPSVGC
jgi:hypothetical protein